MIKKGFKQKKYRSLNHLELSPIFLIKLINKKINNYNLTYNLKELNKTQFNFHFQKNQTNYTQKQRKHRRFLNQMRRMRQDIVLTSRIMGINNKNTIDPLFHL